MNDMSNPALVAVSAALEHVADNEGIDVSDVRLPRMVARLWPDGCLGVPDPEGACMDVITPGYMIELADGYRLHVSNTGDVRSVRTPTVENDIRVRFERDGGLIGGHEEFSTSSWTPPGNDEVELRDLIEECTFFELHSGIPTTLPDEFVFTIWIAVGRRSHTVMFSDGGPLPTPAIGKLLMWLSARLPSNQPGPVVETILLLVKIRLCAQDKLSAKEGDHF